MREVPSDLPESKEFEDDDDDDDHADDVENTVAAHLLFLPCDCVLRMLLWVQVECQLRWCPRWELHRRREAPWEFLLPRAFSKSGSPPPSCSDAAGVVHENDPGTSRGKRANKNAPLRRFAPLKAEPWQPSTRS